MRADQQKVERINAVSQQMKKNNWTTKNQRTACKCMISLHETRCWHLASKSLLTGLPPDYGGEGVNPPGPKQRSDSGERGVNPPRPIILRILCVAKRHPWISRWRDGRMALRSGFGWVLAKIQRPWASSHLGHFFNLTLAALPARRKQHIP